MRSRRRTKEAPAQAAADGALAKRFERKVRLSWLALFAERVWEALLWPFIVVSTFLLVSLLDLWSFVPPLLHRLLLIAFGVALIASFVPLFRIVWPTRTEALRRLERHAEIKHRPATSYEDRLGAAPPKETRALWAAHRERLARLIDRLKPTWPAPRTDRNDPYALRAALMLGLVAAIFAAGGDGWNRMRAAFSPEASGAPSLIRLDAWVTPPVYTGIAPIVLADGSETVGAGAESFRALSVPERSSLIVRTHAPQGEAVSLTTSKDDGSETKAIEPKAGSSEGLVEFNVALTSPLSADVKIGGRTVSKWRFDLIEDEVPTIALLEAPSTMPRGALRLTYRADDDHGVASADASFTLAETEAAEVPAPLPEPVIKGDGADTADTKTESVDTDPLLQPPAMPLQLPKANAKQIQGRATQDLTAHPWAGLKVRMTLIARDQAGQVGESEPHEFVLPEREFTKPLAKAIVEQRKKLVREPDAANSVAHAIDALTLGAEKVIEDSVVYLALRNTYWRLRNDQSREGLASVVEQLWSTALRIEDGDLPVAERDLKAAQDALQKALQENASSEEIKSLVDELRSALSRYLQALASQAEDKGNMPPQQGQDGDQLVSQQDLDQMLQNIQSLAESGSKDLAERMLSELKDILDRLQTGNFAEDARQQRASRMMKDLSEVISEQQKLLDDTFSAKREQGGEAPGDQFEVSPPGPPMEFGQGLDMGQFFDMLREGQQGGNKGQGRSSRQSAPPNSGQMEQGQQQRGTEGQAGDGEFGELAKRQQQLRDQLQSLIDRLSLEGAEPPEQMEGAGEAMGDAQEAIGEGQLDRATQNQSLALDRLRKGAQSMAEQMMQGGEMQAGQGPGSDGRDPLGRPDRSNRPDLGLSVRVPDEIDIQRAREVLDELRRRLGDPARPTFELDYLERLIRSF
ncbi:MAG: TIGR02302 family protein [Methyloceanibacter sp.]